MNEFDEISKLYIEKYQHLSEKYTMKERCGRGSFGDVFRAIDKATNKEYIVLTILFLILL